MPVGCSVRVQLLRFFEKMKELKDGESFRVSATDPGFVSDIKSWCDNTGNQLLEIKKEGHVIQAVIRKGQAKEKPKRVTHHRNPWSCVKTGIKYIGCFQR